MRGGDNPATKKIVGMFTTRYESKYDKQYNVNWAAIKSAEKVGTYYTIGQIDLALEYYFSKFPKHTIWDFIDKLPLIMEHLDYEKQFNSRIRKLFDSTKTKLAEFDIQEGM